MIGMRNAFYERQLLRTLSHSLYGGADLGECLVAARAVDRSGRDVWHRVWTDLADRTFRAACASEQGDHRVSARNAFLRASNYYRSAFVFHLERPLPALVGESHRRHVEAFARAAALFDPPLERLAIPFEGYTLPGYFCSAAPGERRPLVIAVGGYDSSAEEGYLLNAAAAIARGYHCVIFDGPGQGELLIKQGKLMRPDWEKVVSAVIDAMVERDDVASERMAVIGESWGGYLAPRAAAFDTRIGALIVDPPQFSLRRAMLRRLPVPAFLKVGLPDGPRWLVRLLTMLLARTARHPSQGWPLRRGMLVHGTASAWDYFVDAGNYEQADVLGRIACPTLLCDAENDPLSHDSQAFFDLLRCDKQRLRFTVAEGAGDHCIAGARSLYHERVFDWLDARWFGGLRNL